MKMKIILISFIFSSVAFGSTQCVTVAGINDRQAIIFVKEVQRLVKSNDKKKLSTLISYPLRVNTVSNHRQTVTIKNKKQFINQYDNLFTQKTKETILKADPNKIFCNYQGGMIGSGVIWFNNYHSQIRIDAINRN